MGERLRADMAGGHALHPVISHRSRCLHSCLDIAGIDQVSLAGAVGPHARQAIGLKFEGNGEAIALRRHPLLEVAHLLLDAQNLLHMVPDFVRQYVGLRELARSAKTIAKLVEEGEIDIDLLVRRTVKRPGGRLCGSTAGPSVTRKRTSLACR